MCYWFTVRGSRFVSFRQPLFFTANCQPLTALNTKANKHEQNAMDLRWHIQNCVGKKI